MKPKPKPKPKQPDFFDNDPDAAKRARDAALKRIAENAGPWRQKALLAIAALKSFEGNAEAMKLLLLSNGLPKPHHHNVWGEVTKEAIRQGALIPTGGRRHTVTEPSHARNEPVYRSRG